jgi:3-oxoacyl-(acyl-carrier-protein) synthase/acyl carrier protein
MNVGGNRIGTEEIESAILLDRTLEHSPLLNCAVVGMEDAVLGTVPCAFIVLKQGVALLAADEGRIRATVQAQVSPAAVPSHFVVIPMLPETMSGKYMRGLLRTVLAGEALGDLGALKNPDCIDPLRRAVDQFMEHGVPARPSSLAVGADTKTLDQLTAAVLDCVSALTGSADVTASAPLMDVGLDSLSATRLAATLEKQTGIALSPTLVFEFGTAGSIASHLLASLGIKMDPTVVPIDRIGSAISSIQGASCSAGGGVCNLTSAWQTGKTATDNVSSVPPNRWAVGSQIDAHVGYGAFMTHIDLFDNKLFWISRGEADLMDPHQRIALEGGYSALHAADLNRDSLMNSTTGVFVGIFQSDYSVVLLRRGAVGPYSVTAVGCSMLVGRVSFALGLHGPCISFDTACSSSLCALQAALSSHNSHDSDAALVMGVNVMCDHMYSASFVAARMLSPTGKCHTFDARANGYARGEACCSVVLLPELEARGVVCEAGAVRSDGKSASLTAPNGSAQQTLIMAVLRSAARSAQGAYVVEAHGTGTSLGDPIEMRAMYATREDPHLMSLMGCKANVGHTEASAGVTGLLRLMVAMLGSAVCPNAQLRVMNTHVKSVFKGAPAIPTQVKAVLTSAPRVVGGVSSFGLSGTIAHAVLSVQTANKMLCGGVTQLSATLVLPLVCKRRLFPWRNMATSSMAVTSRMGGAKPPRVGGVALSAPSACYANAWAVQSPEVISSKQPSTESLLLAPTGRCSCVGVNGE